MAWQLTYFDAITTKAGVDLYLESKKKQIGNKIKEGMLCKINKHLEHWLNFIGKETKLKELAITGGDDYYHERNQSREKGVNQTTLDNEKSTIIAIVKWLYSREIKYIKTIDFPKLKTFSKDKDSNRRILFENPEILAIYKILCEYVKDIEPNINHSINLVKALCGYFLGIAMITDLRSCEHLQLTWNVT